MQPINYMVNTPNPGASLMEGLQLGQAIRQTRMLRQQEEEATNYKTELMEVMQSNDPKGFVRLAAKYPKHGEGLKKAWEMQGEAQRQAEFGAINQISYAINSGNPQVAMQVVDEQIAAMKNSGQDTKQLENIRRGIEIDPKRVGQYVGMVLSSIAPKEYGENLARLGKERRDEERQPIEMERLSSEAKKARADAESAAVKARFAESDATKELEKKGWDIKKIQNDIQVAKENTRIAAMNSAIAKEGNAIQREELTMKRNDAVQKRDEKVRERAAVAETAMSSLDNTINIVNDLLADESLLDAVGGTAAWGSIPGTHTRSIAGKIEQLQNSVAATNLEKLKGAVSDKDILFIKNIESNLDRYQGEESFMKELLRVGNNLVEAEKRVARHNGMPLKNRNPFPGAVQDGYRFNGGDPANKANWTKL